MWKELSPTSLVIFIQQVLKVLHPLGDLKLGNRGRFTHLEPVEVLLQPDHGHVSELATAFAEKYYCPGKLLVL